ncbi:MAG TPA: glycerophosphodiester phosphodiesterase family protein, partial [Thermoanaerobaculia bacterium]|nr:glycerophosphodiester phosphodiesterase family protein [Thermoanaerobaculia bacterium]
MTYPPPAILAHRGGALEAPENTLAAIAHAIACGADGVELDVRLAADRVPVVFHDPDLVRLAGDPRRISELVWRELRSVRFSSAV